MTSYDLASRLTRTGLALGALVIVVPFACAGLTVTAIPHSIFATTMGIAMVPLSLFIGLLAWQGSKTGDFVHDIVQVIFLQRADALRQLYLAPAEDSIPGAAVLIPVPMFVCGMGGFLASVLSHMPLIATVMLYALMGLAYGFVLFRVMWLWVMPLMVEARTNLL